MMNTKAGLTARTLLALPFAAALALLLAGAPDALAQTEEPERPTNCNVRIGHTLEPFQSVSSTASTLSVTFKDPMPSGYSDSASHRFTICYPDSGGTYHAQQQQTEATKPVAGTTHTFDAVRGLNGAKIQDFAAETDYWVHFGETYGNGSITYYIRTAAEADATAPTLSSATVSGATLKLTYNEALDGTSVPDKSAYTVKVGGTAVSLASTDPVAVSGSAVTLTLAAAVGSSDTVTVSYTVPTTNPVQDSAGNDAAALTDQAVTNNTSAGSGLVSNTGQSQRSLSFGSTLRAQAFTTGSSSGGYRLTSVGIRTDALASTASVRIESSNASNQPGGSLGGLTTTSTREDGVQLFTSTGIALEANTTYFVVWGSGSASYSTTNSDSEDSGGAAGWSIGDSSFKKSNASNPWLFSADSLQMVINGTTNSAPTVANEIPDQTATVGTAFTFTFAADAFSDADGDALTYTAAKPDDMALPSWLSFDASTRTFSGTPTVLGTGTVSVKVTASDGTASVSDTFDIVVSGGAAGSGLVSNTGQSQRSLSFGSTLRAQAFTTGSSSGGYRLTSVGIRTDALASTASVRIESSNASNQPGGSLGGLTTTSTREDGVQLFTSTGIALEANTTYFVVWGSGSASYSTTNSDSEDSGGAAGWSIGDSSFKKSNASNPWLFSADSLQMVINGTTNSAPTVANQIPDQTAGTETAFEFTFAADAFSDADGDALTYTATKSDDGALPGWLSFDASTRTFSGTPAASDVGTVSVKVTASDGAASVSDTFDIVVETAPTLSSAEAVSGGARIRLTFSKNIKLIATELPAAAAFTVTVDGANRSITTYATDSTARPRSIDLGLSGSALTASNTVTVSYDAANAGGDSQKLQDLSGNHVASFTNQPVKTDFTAPTLSSATVRETTLTLTYNEALDGNSVPAASAYTVKVGGTAVNLAATAPVAVSGSAVTLTLAAAVTSSDTVTVSYTAPSTNPVQDASGNDAAALTDQAVTHVGTAPAPSSAAVTDARTLTLTFDKAVTVPPADPNHINPGQKKRGKFPLEDLRYVFTIQGLYSQGVQIPNVGPHRVAVSGSTVTLTLADAVEALPGRQIKVSYEATNADGGHAEHATLQDSDGNKVADFTQSATLALSGDLPPVLDRASVAGKRLQLSFDGGLSGAPAGSRFRVHYDESFQPGLGGTVVYGTGTANIIVSGGPAIEVTLAEAVPQDRFASVSYIAGDDANPLRGVSMAPPGPKVADIRGFFPVTVLDRTPPTLVSATLAGTKLVLTYDEPLDTGSTPAAGDFAVIAGGSTQTVSSVTVNASAVTLTLGASAAANATVTVSYTAGTNKIQDDTTDNPNAAANLSNRTVTNLGPTNTNKPALASADPASAAGPELTLTFTLDLDPAHVPAASDFTLSAGREVSGVVAGLAGQDAVTVRGRRVVLIMSPSWYPCDDTITVSYAKPSSNALRSVWGTQADAFAGQTVTNAWKAECDGTAPRHATLRVVREGAGGSGAVGLQFEEPLQQDRPPDPDDFTVTSKNGPGGNGGAGAQSLPPGSGGGPIGIRTVQFTRDAHGLSLGLTRALGVGERITLTYRRKPGSPGLWTADGDQVDDFTVESEASGEAAPAVESVAVVSNAGDDDTYALGQTIRVAVTFDAAVTVTGAPSLSIDMDPAAWGEKRAAYAGGSGTATLTFAHTVVEPNHSTQGIAVLANSLALNGGTIRSASGADADLAHGGLGHDARHKVDWGLSSNRAPVVDEQSSNYAGFVASGNAPRGVLVTKGFHGMFSDPDGDELTYTVALSDPGQAALVEVLHVPTAAELAETPRRIEVARRVFFRADAAADWGAMDPAVPDPVEIPVTVTARDPGGLSASVEGVFLTHWGPPKVRSVAVVSDAGADDTYGLGDIVRVAVRFDTRVAVDTSGGTPWLAIDMDPADWGRKWASWASGSGTTELVFAYEVVEPNYSTQGIAVLADTLELNGGTIRVDSLYVSAPGSTDAELGHAGLGHDPKHKVDWQPAISVADAEANEGADAAMEFAVSLSRAFSHAEHAVTVDYATADGTATAGEDYTATSGTLTFAPGETEKTVSVPILDDALDEGEETFTLRLSNAQGARIADGEATGTIKNSDPLQKMWLSRFGRTVADHVTTAVSDRLANPLTGAQVTVGGQTVNLAETGDEAFLGRTLTSIAQIMGAPSGPASEGDDGWPGSPGADQAGAGPGSGSVAGPWPGTADFPTATGAPGRLMTGRELLLGSAFHLAKEGDGGRPGLAAWGRVTVGGFDGEAPADGGRVRIDGNVTTGILGTDAEWRRLLAGVAVSVSEGEGTFDQPGVDTGTIESTMTTVSPYARVTLSERVSVWGLAGYGIGDMTIVQAANDATGQPERVTRTDLSMRLAALGGRGALLTADEAGGFDLALKADAFFVETTSEAVSSEGDTSADASRVRLILEGSRAFQVGGSVLTPGVELGLRHDGGDAETGTGVELGGRVTWTDAGTGLSLEAGVRALVAHEDAGYGEWGASGALRLAPGEQGRGLSFSLAPTYGAPGSGVDQLWSARDARGLGAVGGTFEPESRLEGELGYGIALPGGFLATPNVGFAVANGGRDYRVGWRLAPAGAAGLEVNLDALRRESVNLDGADAAPVEHGVQLRGAVRW